MEPKEQQIKQQALSHIRVLSSDPSGRPLAVLIAPTNFNQNLSLDIFNNLGRNNTNDRSDRFK